MPLGPFAFCSVAILLAIPAMAQTSLKIPRNTSEMQEIMRQSEGHCSSCGVVTSVARVEAGGRKDPLEVEDSLSGDPGPGTDIQTSPVFGASKPYSAKNSELGRWHIIVRYDDGTYGSFDQVDQPLVARGDRVQVKADRVELR